MAVQDWKGPAGKKGTECSAGPVLTGQGGMAFNCSRLIEAASKEAALFHWGWWGTGPGCAQRLCMPHPWQQGSEQHALGEDCSAGNKMLFFRLPCKPNRSGTPSFHGLQCPLQMEPGNCDVTAHAPAGTSSAQQRAQHNPWLLCSHALHLAPAHSACQLSSVLKDP